MNRLTDIVRVISQAIHTIKPLLFELILFVWAVIEMGKFIWVIALGGHE
jgi:hypothetical protein